jgi:hypothetical protein
MPPEVERITVYKCQDRSCPNIHLEMWAGGKIVAIATLAPDFVDSLVKEMQQKLDS